MTQTPTNSMFDTDENVPEADPMLDTDPNMLGTDVNMFDIRQ